MSRVYRREFIFGIADGDTLQGVATVSRPSVSANPPELSALREETWIRIGSTARARYETYNSAVARFIPTEPHLHLNMLGVRHTAHGQGLARKLLEMVHALSREDPASSGVSLTTEVEANVSLYQHFGYLLLGRVEFAPGLPAWGFFRANSR
jgi:GNAT superfamily N-acetyltransferase